MQLMNCPECGKRIPSGSLECPECGFDLTQYISKPVTEKKFFSKRIISIFALFLIVLLVVDIAVNLWQNSGHKIEQPSVAPVGVYSSNDGNYLVICSNNMAYYYCTLIEFTELELPWEYSGGRLSVQFSKLHLTAFADIKKDDFSKFVLKADSPNWSNETFTRIDADPDEYIKRKVLTNNPDVTVGHDGTMSFDIDGIMFTVPKQYRIPQNGLELSDVATSFVDNDIVTDYMSELLFYPDSTPSDESIPEAFPGRFLEDVKITDKADITIAGRSAKSFRVTGSLNLGFSALSGIRQTGIYVVIPGSTAGTYIKVLMLQSENRAIDNSGAFDKILSDARQK